MVNSDRTFSCLHEVIHDEIEVTGDEMISSKSKTARLTSKSKKISFTFSSWILMTYVSFLVYLCFRPVSGLHAFRQAQTNWPVVIWGEKGFSPFNPSIPIKGLTNQTWLMEFPLFQWITLGIHNLTSFSIDASARLNALTWALLSVFCLSYFTQKLTKMRKTNIILLISLNPFFLYWATTGLIDWAAVGLGIFGGSIIMTDRFVSLKKKQYFLLKASGSMTFLLGFLIKPSHAIFGIALIAILFFFSESKEKTQSFKAIFVTILISTLVYLFWNNWVGGLYGPDDPRRVWNVSISQWRWFFGSEDQFMNFGSNTSYIFLRFLGSSFGVVSFVIILINIIVKNSFIKITAVLMILSFFYTLILLNLNINHQYYQIPLVFSTGLIISLGISTLIEGRKNQSHVSAYLAIFLLLAIQSVGSSGDANVYVRDVFAKVDKNSLCNSKFLDGAPIVSLGAEQPDAFYECKIKSFQSTFRSSADVTTFKREKSAYKFLYSAIPLDKENQRIFSSLLGIELLETSSKNWYQISQ